jgi:ComF family protein
MPWIVHPCPYCSEPLNAGDSICAACLRSKPNYSAAVCALEYRFPVDILIQRFKHQHKLAIGKVLATLLAKKLAATNLPRDYLLTPVPLHWRRQRSRGFNQSLLVANEISQTTGISLAPDLLRRTRMTADQKSLTRQERFKNLQSAFACSRLPRNTSVIVVDDVITTGATASAISRVLFDAGAEDVAIVALARTPTAPQSALW